MSLYYEGNQKGPGVARPGATSDVFADWIKHGEAVAQLGFFGDRFVLRSRDGPDGAGFRVAVQVQKGEHAEGRGMDGEAFKDADFPYKLVFDAIAGEKAAGPVELGHPGPSGKNEWVWIEPTTHIAHYTTTGSTFEVRNKGNEAKCSVRLEKADASHAGEL